MPLRITPDIVLPDRDLSESFVRASGPGGQNVNKVSTAVELRFNLAESELSSEVKSRLAALAGSRVTDDGELVIEAREHRTQARNREAARERLVELITQALVRPRRRRKTKPTKAARQERIDTKQRRGRVKARRSSKIDLE